MANERDEILLGFDAREMWMPGYSGLHPVHAISTFTLRGDVEKPLSADTMVWPSIFGATECIGPNRPFWENLELLETAIGCIAEPPAHWLVAATWHAEIGFRQETRRYNDPSCTSPMLGPHDEPASLPVLDPAWALLGYDVAGGGFIIGLSNCGYEEDQRAALVERWSPHLNRHHLFEDLPAAFGFRAFSNSRIPEHAPFFVIGLWRIL